MTPLRRVVLPVAGLIGFLITLTLLSQSGGGQAPPIRFYVWSALSFIAVWSGLHFVRGFMTRRMKSSRSEEA